MASRRKNVRRLPALSPSQLRALLRLKAKTDVVYENFWRAAQGTRPPRPPKIEPLLCSIGHVSDFLAKLRPPKPPL